MSVVDPEATAPAAVVAPAHRPAIDLVRAGALVMVVLGHLSLAIIDRHPDGSLRGANALALYPHLAWLSMLAPMPVFFCAAGWANTTASLRTAARRLRAIVGLGAVVVTVWSMASIIELLVVGHGDIVADGARIATQPLWFLAAYVPFTALGARLSRWAARPVVAVGLCLTALAALDIARCGFSAPKAIGWPGFFIAWGVPWLVGAWWRGASEAGRLHELRTGTALAAGSLVAAVALVRFAGYHPGLIDAVPGQRSNTTPPTLYTAVAALAQVGVLMMAAHTLDRIGTRFHRLIDRAGQAAVGVYAWHLSALALCAALLAAGVWAPERLSGWWWLSRPVWFAAVLGVTALFVAATSATRARVSKRHKQGRRREPSPTAPAPAKVLVGVAASTLGAGIVGLLGPRTLPTAVAGAACFLIGWVLLDPP
ncbi:unannotated protein [freshwater metagenome]|uniref:Unannotated protein n=1 Tax=freshwater metagenome TaxID=449393 RepID=A0A6J7F639_9ZZZZ